MLFADGKYFNEDKETAEKIELPIYTHSIKWGSSVILIIAQRTILVISEVIYINVINIILQYNNNGLFRYYIIYS